MKQLVSGFLVGISVLFALEGWWSDQLEMTIQETTKERDEYWAQYYSAKLSEERSDCFQLREQDRLDCEDQLKATWKEAYRQGEAAGKSEAKNKYEDLLARNREFIHVLFRQRDSLRVEMKKIKLNRKTPVYRDHSAPRSAKVVRSTQEEPPIAIARGSVAPGTSKLPLLATYVLGMIFLVLIITLLLLRLRQNRKRRRFRL
ncbi:hypothetical protein [Flavilitoribacter nigricans]|uniref:Uncharacterized protein n=1 Tax=Flavilitoribacter nigricans (strain ATCC 23147 / DSM 23189 / NBRC 102662 / NCIMB 1420 / SS-2) TaxID=1122177 RepID=A0A2D0N8I5_FLAN2|nr:hypothetical protein [Flavilitoribacter nigricans]PHN04073.1 hypothetical protein CRP01_23025 [Flavilitoribacter nigricans DSM 23189 = NBRC 102662]